MNKKTWWMIVGAVLLLLVVGIVINGVVDVTTLVSNDPTPVNVSMPDFPCMPQVEGSLFTGTDPVTLTLDVPEGCNWVRLYQVVGTQVKVVGADSYYIGVERHSFGFPQQEYFALTLWLGDSKPETFDVVVSRDESGTYGLLPIGQN